MDPNAATEWLLMNQDDPNIDVPLSREELNSLMYGQPAQNQEITDCITSNVCTYCVTGPMLYQQQWFECVTWLDIL